MRNEVDLGGDTAGPAWTVGFGGEGRADDSYPVISIVHECKHKFVRYGRDRLAAHFQVSRTSRKSEPCGCYLLAFKRSQVRPSTMTASNAA